MARSSCCIRIAASTNHIDFQFASVLLSALLLPKNQKRKISEENLNAALNCKCFEEKLELRAGHKWGKKDAAMLRRSCCKMHAMSALWLTKRHRLPWSHFAVFWLFIYLVSFCHWNVVWLCLACADNDGQKWNYPSPSSISTMLFECHVVVLSSNDSRALLLENCSKLIAAI